MTRTVSRAIRAAIALGLVAVVTAAAAGGAGATSATAAKALPKMCQKAGITRSMVKKLFGSKATIAGSGVVVSADCPIVSPDAQTPPTGCLDGGDGCLVTEVVVGRASYYNQWVSNVIDYINQGGHAHKAKFSGAGAKGVLVTSTNGYHGYGEPTVLFTTASDSIQIQSSAAGQPEPASVLKLWKRFAHAIFAKLS